MLRDCVSRSGPRAFIFANGELPERNGLRACILPGDFLVAADGGLHHMLRLGLEPQLLIGDLDSVTAGEVASLERRGVRVQRYPIEKDETDLELALLAVQQAGYVTIRVAAALGGRLDQTLGNLALLLLPVLAECDVRLVDGQTEVFLVRARAEVYGQVGDTLSLVPILGPAHGIVTAGLRYPLQDETLWPERTRGISNELVADHTSISLREGTLLCIHTRKTEMD